MGSGSAGQAALARWRNTPVRLSEGRCGIADLPRCVCRAPSRPVPSSILSVSAVAPTPPCPPTVPAHDPVHRAPLSRATLRHRVRLSHQLRHGRACRARFAGVGYGHCVLECTARARRSLPREWLALLLHRAAIAQVDGAPWPSASGGGYANYDRPCIAKLLRQLQRALIKAGTSYRATRSAASVPVL